MKVYVFRVIDENYSSTLLEAFRIPARDFTITQKNRNRDLKVVPYVYGIGSHGFRIKVGDASQDSNDFASVAFNLPNGDRKINYKKTYDASYDLKRSRTYEKYSGRIDLLCWR